MNPKPGDYQKEAIDFLRQSLRDYEAEAWKFAVLHGSMAIEMLPPEHYGGGAYPAAWEGR